MYSYPIVITPDTGDTVLLTFPDLPEAATFGEDEDEARLRAINALETAIIGRMSEREDIPAPSRPRKGQALVTLPTLSAAKVALYREMRTQGVTKAELARRLHCDFSEAARLLDLRHASRLDRLDAALAALDKRLDVRIVAIGAPARSGKIIPGAVVRSAAATHRGTASLAVLKKAVKKERAASKLRVRTTRPRV